MANLNKFGSDISSFRNGSFSYTASYNSLGNLYFKKEGEFLNEEFLKLSCVNLEYDDDKFSKIHPIKFTEFVDISEEKTSLSEEDLLKIQQLEYEVDSLKKEISSNHSIDEVLRLESAVKSDKDLIIQLRISAGEGNVVEDFVDKFPYLSKFPSSVTSSSEIIKLDSLKISELNDELQRLKFQLTSSINSGNVTKVSTPITDNKISILTSELTSSRDLVTKLRIESGEGRTGEDFSKVYPYNRIGHPSFGGGKGITGNRGNNLSRNRHLNDRVRSFGFKHGI